MKRDDEHLIKEACHYVDLVYPLDISPNQRQDILDCFMAGALSTISRIKKISDLPEDEAMKYLDDIDNELTKYGIGVVTDKRRKKG